MSQALAEACAGRMWDGDAASRGLGMALDRVGPGAATLSMTVTPAMLNGHGTCHGGFIFALADSAFAFACNTDGMASVAAHCAISFLRPARLGDVLVATAIERHREGRSGITDVRVTLARSGGEREGCGADGGGAEVVAEFRGHSRTTGARIVDP